MHITAPHRRESPPTFPCSVLLQRPPARTSVCDPAFAASADPIARPPRCSNEPPTACSIPSFADRGLRALSPAGPAPVAPPPSSTGSARSKSPAGSRRATNGCSPLSFQFIVSLCVASCQVRTQLCLVFFSPVQILQLAAVQQHHLSLSVPVRPSGVRHFARFVPIDLAQHWQQLAQHHTSRCLFLSAN
jgi:hypothetical protein